MGEQPEREKGGLDWHRKVFSSAKSVSPVLALFPSPFIEKNQLLGVRLRAAPSLLQPLTTTK